MHSLRMVAVFWFAVFSNSVSAQCTPLMCNRCSGCVLHVVPIDVMLQWTWPRTLTIPIPNNRHLVGAFSCVQNFL